MCMCMFMCVCTVPYSLRRLGGQPRLSLGDYSFRSTGHGPRAACRASATVESSVYGLLNDNMHAPYCMACHGHGCVSLGLPFCHMARHGPCLLCLQCKAALQGGHGTRTPSPTPTPTPTPTAHRSAAQNFAAKTKARKAGRLRVQCPAPQQIRFISPSPPSEPRRNRHAACYRREYNSRPLPSRVVVVG